MSPQEALEYLSDRIDRGGEKAYNEAVETLNKALACTKPVLTEVTTEELMEELRNRYGLYLFVGIHGMVVSNEVQTFTSLNGPMVALLGMAHMVTRIIEMNLFRNMTQSDKDPREKGS